MALAWAAGVQGQGAYSVGLQPGLAAGLLVGAVAQVAHKAGDGGIGYVGNLRHLLAL